MSSNTLGEGAVAEELAEGQRSIAISEFFEKNKQMLGFDSEAKALITAVKEAVDNALDATEEAGILPDLYVKIEDVSDESYYRVIVEDNGPGIPAENVPNVFGKLLYGSRFHSRVQTRGQQGIGISAAVMYGQLTTGKPATIVSKPDNKDDAYRVQMEMDTDNNEPVVKNEKRIEWDRPHGTRVEIDMEANMRSRSQLHDYIEQTAVVNPHARITFDEPRLSEPMEFDRVVDELPDETEEIKPHPHGVELGTVKKMLAATDSYSVSGFLQNDFTRVGQKSAESILNNFRDRFYGRHPAWTQPADTADIVEAAADAASSKGSDAATTFGNLVVDELPDGPASYLDVSAAVTAAADTAEDDTGKRFGDTVRENTIEAVWATHAPSYDRLYPLLDETTSAQKNGQALKNFAERLVEKFDTDHDGTETLYTRDDVQAYVARVASTTEEVDDLSFGETSINKITDALWDEMAVATARDIPNVSEFEGDRDKIEALLNGMRDARVIAPPTDCLSPIGEDKMVAGLKQVFTGADFYGSSTRDADVNEGDPFIAEAAIAYGGDITDGERAETLRFANRVPLVYARSRGAITEVIKRINWRNYGLDQTGGSGIPKDDVVIMVHIASTNVPFTSESKDAVADVPGIKDEVERALREAGRDLSSHIDRQQELAERRKKTNVLTDLFPTMSEQVSDALDRDNPDGVAEALARVMNNLYVETSSDGDDVVVRAANFNNSKHRDVEVTAILPTEPSDVDDSATVVETDGEYHVTWDVEVKRGSEEQVVIQGADVTPDDITTVVDGLADEKITFDNEV